MPEKHPSSILRGLSNFLITLGTPPFFALKILVWSIYWFSRLIFRVSKGLLAIIVSTGETTLWLGRIVLTAILKFAGYLDWKIKNSLPKITSSFQKLADKVRNIKSKIVSLESKFRLKLRPKGPKVIFVKKTVPKIRAGIKIGITLKDKLVYLFVGISLCFIVFFLPYWLSNTLSQLPNPRMLSTRDIAVSTKIYDRNRVLLYQIYSNENRSIIKLTDLPKHLINATIAIEDSQFYQHSGVDLRGVVRAVIANSSGKPTQGGSTITQQLVKSALLSPERTFSRKIKEIIVSFWAERIYSKPQILEMYFNQVPYGGASYGIEAAAQTYFNKHAKDLTLGESSLLAGLPAAPSIYSPFGAHPELARERQRQVLDAMVKQKYIDRFAANQAMNEELKLASLESEIKAPHFVMYVKDYLIKKYGLRTVEQGGLEVITSLDYDVYERVSRQIREGVEKQKALSVGNGAALVTNPKTGEIIAMVGSTNYFDTDHDGNVNVVIANRSPGSSIKPLVYALALDRGLITTSTIIDDSPITYRIAGSSAYSPQNYDNRFHGRVTVRTALGSSFNIPAVKIMDKLGVINFLDFAPKLGINTLKETNRYGLSLALGGGEIKMEEMATAFSALTNNGLKASLKPVLLVTDYQGKILEDKRNSTNLSRVMSPQTAFLVSNILADDGARAPTFGAGSVLNIPGKTVSVKTGTTQEKRDNWTIGYTPSILVAVWVGNNNNSPMSPYLESGRTGAAAIWNPIMTELLAQKPNEPITKPNDVVAVQICALNGLLACENCPVVVTEYFTRGTEPTKTCNITREDREKFDREKEEREKKKQEGR